MTNEEMERGIEFLLKCQADFEARQADFEAQFAKTSQQIEVMVQTHTEFTRFVQGYIAAQSELNQSLRETVRALTLAQARTDVRLSDLEGSGS